MAEDDLTKSDSSVAELQRVLTAYAKITGFTAADPGTADGIIGMKTVLAVVSILPRVPGLPREVTMMAPMIGLMLATEDGKTAAFKLIKSNAGLISKAIIAMEVYRTGSGSAPSPAPTATTPTVTSVKAGTIWAQGGRIDPSMLAPVRVPGGSIVNTPGGPIPGDPNLTIWFHDRIRKVWRIAVPKPGLHGFNDYVEVAPAASAPAFGTEVNRMTFMSAVGKWYWTPGGMAAVAGGVLGLGALTFAGLRAVLR